MKCLFVVVVMVLMLGVLPYPAVSKEVLPHSSIERSSPRPSLLLIEGQELDVLVTAVIDGQSFTTSDRREVRLWGIEAPSAREDGFWQAGMVLEGLIGPQKQLRCVFKHKAQEQQEVMQCFIGELDLGSMMVNAGWARHSDPYYQEEAKIAKGAGRGLWAKNQKE